MILQLTEPHLSFFNEDNKLPFLEGLARTLTQDPESLLVLGVFDEDELIAFIIVQNPGFQLPHVSVLQCWSKPGNEYEIADDVFSWVILWAWSLGKTSIRGETQRSTAALFHRFGFEPIAQVVSFKILPEHRDSVTEGLKEFVHHGRPI